MPETRRSLLFDLQSTGTGARWEEFASRYRPLIAHAARRSGVHQQDVDDVVQAVLLQLVRILPSFSYQREKGFFRSWLRRITMNIAIDLHRKHRLQWTSLEDANAVPVTEIDADAAFDRELLQAAMQHVQGTVRQRAWDCFALHHLEQKSAAQVSMLLGLSENAVYINSSRVLGRLREFCEFHGEDLHHERNSSLIS